MSEKHRPDVDAWRRKQRAKDAYLWPYINLEDLCRTRTLLLLLHARGRHQPHEFAHADVEQAILGETSGVTMPAFLNEYSMLFHNRNDPNTYGELVSWDDDLRSFENMIDGVAMHPGHGLQALEIQQRLWRFLLDVCKILLQDMTSLSDYEILPDPGPPAVPDAEFSTLNIVAQEAPYRLPAQLSFKQLKSLIAAERNAREDHLHLLREDPSYFETIMTRAAEHRQEHLPDTMGREHPTMKEPCRAMFWNRVLFAEVVNPYLGLVTFDGLLKQVDILSNRYKQYKATLHVEKRLPPKLMKAFQKLRFELDAVRIDIINRLRMELFGSPSFRPFCKREPQDPKTSKIRTAYQPPEKEHAIKQLMPLFDILINEQQLFLFGLHNVTDEIEHLTQTNPAVKALISPLIAERLSSLAVVSECLHQLHLFQPWARKIEDGIDEKKQKFLSQYRDNFGGWLELLGHKFEGTQI